MVFGLSAYCAFLFHDGIVLAYENDRAGGKLRIPLEDGNYTIRHYWHIRRRQGRG
jgi:hypothetical protein